MAGYALLKRLRRPEHTGIHRCWPCTVANLLLLAIACLALGRVRKPLATALGIAGAGVIWLRGYLVPYTPRFAPQLASLVPGDPFHDDPIEPSSGSGPAPAAPEEGGGPEGAGPATRELEHNGNAGSDEPERDADRARESEPAQGSLSKPGDAATGEDLLKSLVEAGVLEADAESVAPTDAFRRLWDQEIEALREVDDGRLAEAALAESAAVEADVVTREDRTYVTLAAESGRTIDESWLRRPTAIGQTAAARALAKMDVPGSDRPGAAVAMEMFLTECPDCGSELVERPVGGCCGPPQTGADGRPRTGLTCPDCRVHLHVFD